jgi:hypothetical protein
MLIQVVPPDFCHFSKFQALAMDSSPLRFQPRSTYATGSSESHKLLRTLQRNFQLRLYSHRYNIMVMTAVSITLAYRAAVDCTSSTRLFIGGGGHCHWCPSNYRNIVQIYSTIAVATATDPMQWHCYELLVVFLAHISLIYLIPCSYHSVFGRLS